MKIPLQVPSWNRMYRVHGSIVYKTAEAKQFQRDLSMLYVGKYHEGLVEMRIIIERNPIIDCDNAAKAICDSLQGRAYKTDRQIRKLSIEMLPCPKGKDTIDISVSELI